MMMAVLALSTAACGADGETTAVAHRQAILGEALSTSTVANKDKPLVWFNRQPSKQFYRRA